MEPASASKGTRSRAANAPTPAGYSGTPLPKKLGIRPDTTVALAGAPVGFESTLGPLPAGVRLRRSARGACDVALWFVASRAAYARGLPGWAARNDWRALWICWPKQASGLQTDLGESVVRTQALPHGIVDYKICAVDATWSGLCFAHRKGDGGTRPTPSKSARRRS
jgi:hypothetical protein